MAKSLYKGLYVMKEACIMFKKVFYPNRLDKAHWKVRKQGLMPDYAVAVTLLLTGISVIGLLFSLRSAHAETIMYVAVSPGSTLNVRDGPGITNPIMYWLERGDVITALDNKGGWVLVNRAGDWGWASIDYLSDTPPGDIPQTAKIISNGRVALRDKPGGVRVVWLENGKQVDVLGYLDGWVRVRSETRTGYVMMKYVEVTY